MTFILKTRKVYEKSIFVSIQYYYIKKNIKRFNDKFNNFITSLILSLLHYYIVVI